VVNSFFLLLRVLFYNPIRILDGSVNDLLNPLRVLFVRMLLVAVSDGFLVENSRVLRKFLSLSDKEFVQCLCRDNAESVRGHAKSRPGP